MRRTGSCTECGFDWEDAVGNLAQQLQPIPLEFEGALSTCDEAALRTRPAASVWSPLEYAAHTRDVLAWFEERIRRVLTEERPQLSAVGWASSTEERSYHREGTSAVIAGVGDASSSLCGLLSSLSSEEWVRVGVGSEGDERDVAILARRAVHEAVHHLSDVRRQTERLTGRARSEPPA